MSSSDRMSREAFLAIVGHLATEARAHVRAAALVAAHGNRAIERITAVDPALGGMLRQAVIDRGERAKRILDHITSRQEQKQ